MKKVVGRQIYFHVEALSSFDSDVRSSISKAEMLAGLKALEDYNIIRVDKDGGNISFLDYPDFLLEPFPVLGNSWKVDIESEKISYRTYSDSLNPPILHRKELLMPPGSPGRDLSLALTEMAESIGLFEDTKRIGYLKQWESLIQEKGYRLVGYSLVPIGNDGTDKVEEVKLEPLHTGWDASRHLTAMVRYGFSAPTQSLARHGFFGGQHSFFDYGCGRGDDVRGLVENGLTASGWDPYFAPSNPKKSASIVNLGFVINVIEDYEERVDALIAAWSLAERMLVVSVMLSNQNAPRGQRYGDGIITSRGTFQKYYTQAEIKAFVEHVLDEEPIPVAPGVLYVFRDKDLEQRFQMGRYRSRYNRLRNPSPQQLEHREKAKRNRAEERYRTYRKPLDQLWDQWLKLGRKPQRDEVPGLVTLLEGFGTLGKALRFLVNRYGTEELEQSEKKRVEDLKVYFALNQFERRRPYKHMELGLQRDIKAFFGSNSNAQAQSRELLFSIADIEAIDAACKSASKYGLGWLIEGESLQLHASLVEQLPPLLRVYLGCAAILYGDYRNADLVKIHVRSGKVTLMRFEDFDESALPRMMERVKIKLREQDIDYFEYGSEYDPPFLYNKSRYINEEFPRYPEQLEFDEAMNDLQLFDLEGYGPQPNRFIAELHANRLEIEGYELRRSKTIPSLADLCGRFLTYRDLIECGETQAETQLQNLPNQIDSYNALYELALHVLDPVIDYFGMIKLTYGFCSPELSRKIPGDICPKLDQHSAHELNRLGNTICSRLGAAVDFIVEDECMLEVAQW